MGIRFACHVCSKKLNVKQELAGRRGICPACSARFRIPLDDSETSAPVESPPGSAAALPTNGHCEATHSTTARPVADGPQTPGPVQTDATAPSLALLDEDPQSTWYVRPPSGGQYGPATGEVLRQWISEGRVASTSLLWREGWPQWREAKDALPELVDRLPDASLDGSSLSVPVNSREAAEFGFGDSATSQTSDPVVSTNQLTGKLAGRVDAGSERRARSDRRTSMIVGLAALAICLIIALALVLSL